jgi:hypothetical protein
MSISVLEMVDLGMSEIISSQTLYSDISRLSIIASDVLISSVYISSSIDITSSP